MDAILDTSIFLGKFLYFFLESLVYKIIPKRKKTVAGEIVLITGAGSGLGRQLAIQFAGLGAILVLWDINEEGNRETSRLVKENGGVKVFAYVCDCSDRQEVYSVAKQVKKEVGDVTILINNAGIVTGKQFLDIPDNMVEKSFLVNALSHFWTYKAFLPAMITANHGHLVCISSAAGLCGINRLSDYSATKFAACGTAESLFFELSLQRKSEVKTTIICPYLIKTTMFEGCETKYPFLLPILDVKFVAQKIVNAILEEELYVTFPKYLYVLQSMKLLLSTKMFLALALYLGVDTCTAALEERKTAEEIHTETEEIPKAQSSSVVMQ
ncbi:epidermal retinol dehydrogenase 2 [Orycteropus afer afer]|uniref:Epidermal retinol dehydrogenase 2 n=1 Tax=Orycteropus afer afer TaxID=1230840 RepID=A0A8B6ZRF7_ORYAF|nr:epidermal retinol dehydrogenase 2 [Orycteropus afer afer]